MEPEADGSITRLLAEWRGGSEAALAKLAPLLYQELLALAQRHLRRERRENTLQRTALVHEAFLRLFSQQSVDWQSRAHFFGLASSIMRRILVDHARARLASKRGGSTPILSLEEITGPKESDETAPPSEAESIPAPRQPEDESGDDIAAVDEALVRLARVDPRQVKIVEMRYFAGLTIQETAEVLEVSDATVKREWNLARAWLRRELGSL
jgi:RNA polymerase sigma factor (TIGR02999 family)